MAKQCGVIQITGTIDNFCFYKMGGKYYVRQKSSLNGKRVKKDPAFRRTMQYAGLLAQASKIASRCYRTLPREEREHGLYRKMTGAAMQLLKSGMDVAEVVAELEGLFLRVQAQLPVCGVRERDQFHTFGNNVETFYARGCLHTSKFRFKIQGTKKGPAESARPLWELTGSNRRPLRC